MGARRRCPALDPPDEDELKLFDELDDDDIGDSREERAFRMWINSLGLPGTYVSNLFDRVAARIDGEANGHSSRPTRDTSWPWWRGHMYWAQSQTSSCAIFIDPVREPLYGLSFSAGVCRPKHAHCIIKLLSIQIPTQCTI